MIIDTGICMVLLFSAIALVSLHPRGASLRQHSREQARSPVLTILCGSYGAGSSTAVVCSRDVGTGELYAVVDWIPVAMLVQFAHWTFSPVRPYSYRAF